MEPKPPYKEGEVINIVPHIRLDEYETVKERPFEADPRRHFQEKRQAMIDRLVKQITDASLFEESLKPTGVPHEFTMAITLRVLK